MERSVELIIILRQQFRAISQSSGDSDYSPVEGLELCYLMPAVQVGDLHPKIDNNFNTRATLIINLTLIILSFIQSNELEASLPPLTQIMDKLLDYFEPNMALSHMYTHSVIP